MGTYLFINKSKRTTFVNTARSALVCSLLTVAISGCSVNEDTEAPALLSENPSEAREGYFEALWYGEYERLDDLIPALQAEAEAGDAYSQAILGFSYGWKLAEYRRDLDADPNIGLNAEKAVDAFDSAMKLIPGDARLLGFRGSYLQAQGRIDNNQLLTIRGFIDESNAATRWPAWGLFTKAYGLITLSPESSLY
ncbi:MAG: hypothetical protein MI976_12780 [Pseudomonadales bacterium]|nr:hypothetical protein [Pseudomonadales bacterium]